jgi:glycosyltransferase involved in cell wall biosynthesis
MGISVIIPSRNEPYLVKTIQDLLSKATGKIEIIVILDGYWPPIKEIINHPRVSYIHFSKAKGMRNAINSGISVAKYDYVLKTDAHCLFAKGFDNILIDTYQDNWLVVPRRYRLDPVKWELIEDGRPPVDYEYIDSSDLHGVRWEEKAEERKYIWIDDIISAQGSCWFMRKDHFERLGGLDDVNYGTFFLEFQELAFKVWKYGGRVVVNKNTYYAHWHKTEGRGYSVGASEREKAVKFIQGWRKDKKWREIIKKFMPMPTW